MLISKKDLLVETGISYGQLYRWKRECLIPEEWFMKQSSYTGQETFFPKVQMLNRIRAIQELKDKYSLEELAKFLSPEVTESEFTIDDLEKMEEISNDLIENFQMILEKDNISYMEVLILVILSDIRDEFHLTILQTGDMLAGIKSYLEEIKSTGFIVAVLVKEKEYNIVIYQDQSQIYFDERFHIVKKVLIDDISNQMKIKYRKGFNFQFNQEETKQEEAKWEETKQKETNKKNNGTKSEKKDQDKDDFIFKFNNWEVRL